MKLTTEEKFWARVVQQGECLIWTGPVDPRTGIGRFRVDGLDISTHRYVFSLANGSENLPVFIRHSCDNQACVFISHLVPWIRQENENPEFDNLLCQIEGCDNKAESRGKGQKPRRICSSCRRKRLQSPELDSRVKVTIEMEQMILKLHKQGLLQKEVSKIVGLCTSSVGKTLSRLGFPTGKGQGKARLYPKVPEGMKWCYKCEKPKWIADFWAHRNARDGLCGACKECMAEAHSQNRGSMRHRAKKTYGITLEEYDEMMAATPFCPICNKPTDSLDHNGITGQLRSPLDRNCNLAIGLLDHDPTLLRAAADYIESWNNE